MFRLRLKPPILCINSLSRSSFPSTDRFSRPSIGGRARPGARTTASPEPAAEPAVEEEIAPAKEVKPVSSGFARGRRKLSSS